MRIDAKDVIAWLRDADLEPYSYSGRAMYGASCVGVTVEPRQMLALGAMLAREASYADESRDYDVADEVVHLMQHARDDNMGRDVVVYWPHLTWPDDEEEDDGGDD